MSNNAFAPNSDAQDSKLEMPFAQPLFRSAEVRPDFKNVSAPTSKSELVEPKKTPVPEYPCYVERSAFVVTESDILAQLAEFLRSVAGVDIEYLPQKHKIKGLAFLENRCAAFRVFMYRDQKKGQFLVEFQRRSGCCWCFSSLFKRVRAHFLPKEKENAPKSEKPNLHEFLILDEATAKLLASWGETPDEHLSELISLLCRFSSSASTHSRLIEITGGVGKIISLIREGLSSEEIEVKRDSSLLLANLANSKQLFGREAAELQSEIAKKLLECLWELKQGSGLEVLDAQRHALRCVDSLPAGLLCGSKYSPGKMEEVALPPPGKLVHD